MAHLFQYPGIIYDPARISVCLPAFHRKRNSPWHTLKQYNPHFFLQCFDCLAHTGLGCIKKLGSLADRACFCTHYKIFQLLQIQHIYSLSGENFSLFTSAFVLFLCFLIYIQRKSAKIPSTDCKINVTRPFEISTRPCPKENYQASLPPDFFLPLYHIFLLSQAVYFQFKQVIEISYSQLSLFHIRQDQISMLSFNPY